MITLPPRSLDALKFAYQIADHYAARGGDVRDLFGAFAGLVVNYNKEVGYKCLMALDETSQTTVIKCD